MSVELRAAAIDHLRDRRARGYVLADHDQLIAAFLDGLAARGQATITVADAVAFATEHPDTTRHWQAARLRAIRGFAAHVRTLDPAAAQLIPVGLIASKMPRRIPFLYSEEQIAELMSRALMLTPALLAATMHTLIGLLAATGIRSGEAGALDVEDFDAERQALIVTGKNKRVRLVALHPSTVQALADYQEVRGTRAPPTGALLVGPKGARLNLNSARAWFRALVNDCQLPVGPGCRAPRLHDILSLIHI